MQRVKMVTLRRPGPRFGSQRTKRCQGTREVKLCRNPSLFGTGGVRALTNCSRRQGGISIPLMPFSRNWRRGSESAVLPEEVSALQQPLQLQADGCRGMESPAQMDVPHPARCKTDTSEETCKTK